MDLESSVLSNCMLCFLKLTQQEDSLFASMPPLCPIGSHPKVQSPKPITGGLGAFTKVSIYWKYSSAILSFLWLLELME